MFTVYACCYDSVSVNQKNDLVRWAGFALID